MDYPLCSGHPGNSCAWQNPNIIQNDSAQIVLLTVYFIQLVDKPDSFFAGIIRLPWHIDHKMIDANHVCLGDETRLLLKSLPPLSFCKAHPTPPDPNRPERRKSIHTQLVQTVLHSFH